MANERRLIDANTLQSELIERQYHDQTMGILHSYYPHFRGIVAKQPTVDAVEVCFCKDCKHMERTPDNLRWCNAWNSINGMGDDGYCNYGEKRESGIQPQREDV